MRRGSATSGRSWPSKAASARMRGAFSKQRVTSLSTAAAQWGDTRQFGSITRPVCCWVDLTCVRMDSRSDGEGMTMRQIVSVMLVAALFTAACGKSEAQKQAEQAAENLKKAAEDMVLNRSTDAR